MSNENTSTVERRRAIFHGRVQGVFFRATTVEISRGFRVTGYVRNCANGTVELEVEGSPDQVDGLLKAIRRHFERNIRDTDITNIPPRGNESAFEVRY